MAVGFVVPKGPGDFTVRRVDVPTDEEGRPKLFMQTLMVDPDQSDVPQGGTDRVAKWVRDTYGVEPIIVRDIVANVRGGEANLVVVPN